ncbi:ankyrin repeat protein [Rhodanobacter sp. K2T2]|uniref:ankyrin repeat domain-containing protein n=1 Tax=Rhodanobacter sp. K2T2 TaxID=2723085 RepID=UPI0015CE26EC|nr:ankyrin repeat domain-containing protein [Rhodanobacter sp. K2T2]NYE29696.1 ankyrin repeat protein [Rhodanobacter sp. K2T2]
MKQLSSSEYSELQSAFADLVNYESEDPTAAIEPLSYVAPDGDTCLHAASHRGNLRAVELLIKAGLDINRRGDMGSTPLHYASRPEVISFLITNGASQMIRNDFGQFPLGYKAGNDAL